MAQTKSLLSQGHSYCSSGCRSPEGRKWSGPLKAYGRGKAADLVTGAGRIERPIEQANVGSTPAPTLHSERTHSSVTR